MPVYNTNIAWLWRCINSILNQTFREFELCICDNGSDPEYTSLLKEFEASNYRVKLVRLDTNYGGYAGVNAAMDISSGRYIGLMDSDDILELNALEEISKVLLDETQVLTKIVYTDEMLIDSEGKDILPFFKPDFTVGLLMRLHYFGHLTVYHSSLIKALRLKHAGGSYDYDLALRAALQVGPMEIKHIPQLLYKYRSYPESTSSRSKEACIYGGLHSLQFYLNEKLPGTMAILDEPFYGVMYPNGIKMKLWAEIKPYGGYETWLLPQIFEKQRC